MAVSWLVFDGAKGQIRMISVLATPARGRWVDQCLCALVSCCKVALCAIEETCQMELTKDRPSPPQTTQEASHASLRSPRHLRDEKPGDLCSQPPRCAQVRAQLGCLRAASL